jgi:hypothetical protein
MQLRNIGKTMMTLRTHACRAGNRANTCAGEPKSFKRL